MKTYFTVTLKYRLARCTDCRDFLHRLAIELNVCFREELRKNGISTHIFPKLSSAKSVKIFFLNQLYFAEIKSINI